MSRFGLRGRGAVACAFLALAARVFAQGQGSSRVDYAIQARLDAETKRLSGSLALTWTNTSGEAVDDLWFHLYLNAFSNNRSTHLIESQGRLRDAEMESGWGWSRVSAASVLAAGGTQPIDVLASLRYRRPDDENEDDRTVFSLDLPAPLASGESVTVFLEWESQLPRVRRRTGYKGDFLLVAQWFPKLGVYEEGRGWNCHQFHARTEFFADYGHYEVELDLPAEYEGRVGGSGVLEVERIEGGRLKVRFLAPSAKDRDERGALVHDFTWTGDPRYVVEHGIFRWREWAERYPSEVERVQSALAPGETHGLRDVDVVVLIHPERADQAERHFQATCAALFFYGLWFGAYPYQQVTVVDPAWGAGAAGGMEYPTLFTCGTRLFTTPDMHVPEGVTVHECGHQFWYGLTGNNEFEAAWLDEGFNSYTDSEVLWRAYGPGRATTAYAALPCDGVALASLPAGGALVDSLAARRLPLPWLDDPTPLRDSGFLDWWRDQPALSFVRQTSDPRWHDRTRYLVDPDSDVIDTPGWRYVDGTSYVTNSYPRTAVALRTLEGMVGPNAFLRGMRGYALEWRYRHPYPDDFLASFQEHAGVDIGWYFREVFRGTGTVDWRVEVQQEKERSPKGFFQSEGGEFFERPGAAPSDSDDEEEEEADDSAASTTPESDASAAEAPPSAAPTRWAIEVLLRKEGALALDLPVRLTFADGTTREETWLREEQLARAWKRIAIESTVRLASVEIDPERRTYLDTDLSNNRWFRVTDERTPWRYGERALARFQRYLQWIQGLGG
jgi:hypothetical protein